MSSANKNPVKAAFRLVTACDREDRATPFSFRYLDVIGNGTFGIVCRARDLATNAIVAIKTVYQDEGHQNRELSIIKALEHGNIVALQRYFYTRNEHREEFLSLVLEWMPTSVDRLLRDGERTVPLPLVQRAFQQFAQALQYLHGVGVCHRDIKPHNLLLDPHTGMVKLCDFGCSKRLQRGESNIQYICARYYRAPEIVLGWGCYSVAIDLWSAGCVLAELLMGRPIFPGKNSIDQLAKIIRVLGAPTAAEMVAMGQEPKRLGLKAPLALDERRRALRAVVPSEVPDDGVDLLAALLQYDPEKRLTPSQIIAHPFLQDIQPIPKMSSLPPTPTRSKVKA
ncbi:Protein kinase shaggy-like isoform x6 [Paramicrosporidium saccamoebae]|uniref:Protein kinase shaggy-like isoform x6 n=1 Tax=Paramicrosporidium saccamoebae TaxID=1246581 RepID=A0A2H9THX7_9FUNG|nr:Protein kinase shaggy-like isoform x6 [Paramicrosporidium saccamoebae]